MILPLRNNDVVYTPVSISSSGDNSVIAADANNRKHRVLGFFLVAAAGVSITFKSGLAGSATSRSGAMPMIAGTPFAMPGGAIACWETKPGEALNLSLSGAVAVTGFLLTLPI